MDAQAPVLVSLPQRPGHRERLEGLDDLLGTLALRARAQAAIGLQVALLRVHIDDEEDAAEEIEQLIELGEDLLEEKVVRLHHKDRAGGADRGTRG